jgi:hypothetical protein
MLRPQNLAGLVFSPERSRPDPSKGGGKEM